MARGAADGRAQPQRQAATRRRSRVLSRSNRSALDVAAAGPGDGPAGSSSGFGWDGIGVTPSRFSGEVDRAALGELAFMR